MDIENKLVYELMEIVCDNCNKNGGECISCNVASKMFKVLDNYIIEEEEDEVEKARKELLGKIPWLTEDKKKKLKKFQGSATIPIDLNKVREYDKYGVELNYMWNKDEDENE